MITRTLYLDRIRPFMYKPVIKVLTGLRRSGKSVLLTQIRDLLLADGVPSKNIVSINLESAKYHAILNSDQFTRLIHEQAPEATGKVFFLLDEVQNVEGWERTIASLMVDFDSDIYITGSNSKLLSGELATHIAGRYIEFQVFPFSFKEFIEVSPPGKTTDEYFDDYRQLGGMPFLHFLNFDPTTSRDYLQGVFDSVMIKDIVGRREIRDVDLLRRVIWFVMANIGNPYSARSIATYFKSENRIVATETVLNYLDACVEACLFQRVANQDLVGKRILKVDEKYYLTDHGFRSLVSMPTNRDIGLILENLVCIELLRRGFQVQIGRIEGNEIDFVATKAGRPIYFQVAYLIPDSQTHDREVRPLLKVVDNYPKYILTMDPITIQEQGIIHQRIPEFLLDTGQFE